MTPRSLEAVLTDKATRDFGVAAVEFPGAALRHVGERVVATRLPALPGAAPYNKARGLTLDDRAVVAELVEFYGETAQRPRIEVWGQDDVPELRHLLLSLGYTPGAETVALEARPHTYPADPSTGVQVHEVDPADRRYIDVLAAGYAVEADARDRRRMLTIEHSTPGLRRYLATVDGHPAAAAGLYPGSGSSIFVGAATVFGFRRRGAQSALIRRRMDDASSGSGSLVSTATRGSASHANLERFGFEVSHVRTLWQ